MTLKTPAACSQCGLAHGELPARFAQYCRGVSGRSRREELWYIQSRLNRQAGLPPPTCPDIAAALLPCVYRGAKAGNLKMCGSPPIYACEKHYRCTLEAHACSDLKSCRNCADRLPEHGCLRRFDQFNLSPGQTGYRFNPSLMAVGKGYVMAYRDGWAGSNVHLIRLSDSFDPAADAQRLNLTHPEATFGREDPRLFMFRDQPHVMFTGVKGPVGPTSVLYARLNERLEVDQIYYPHYAKRQPWEKNWGVFEHGGQLHAVYTISPRRILKIDGERAELISEEPFITEWEGGPMHGGPAPFWYRGEMWHIFHDKISGPDGKEQYRTGVYTFDPEPPFKPIRFLSGLLQEADPATRPADQYANVVFTGGAVVVGEHLILAVGVHDRSCELRRLSLPEIERRMKTL
jgi:predicted GH43/DUF377 family glycosyl hydrolase